MDCGGHPLCLLRRVVIPPKDGTHGKVPSNTKISIAELLVVPYAKCASSTKYTYIQNILYTFLYVRRFIHAESDSSQYIHGSLDAPWQVHSHFVDLL